MSSRMSAPGDTLISLRSRLQRVVALTGAGVSAGSGIPTYRDDQGQWLRSSPIQHQQFVGEAVSRQRYWARSMVGWPYVQRARPNAAHRALARLEQAGWLELLVTQNVDRLHQQAGSRQVVDLHGRLDRVKCLACQAELEREHYQQELLGLNPHMHDPAGHGGTETRPDGDADLADRLLDGFTVPDCRACGGLLMPDVVFFGGTVPRERVAHISQAIEQADALLVVGSSLMVYSGYRFCKLAHELGKALIIINRGKTRADELASLKLEGDCAELLGQLL